MQLVEAASCEPWRESDGIERCPLVIGACSPVGCHGSARRYRSWSSTRCWLPTASVMCCLVLVLPVASRQNREIC
jgi:hypothetical protein